MTRSARARWSGLGAALATCVAAPAQERLAVLPTIEARLPVSARSTCVPPTLREWDEGLRARFVDDGEHLRVLELHRERPAHSWVRPLRTYLETSADPEASDRRFFLPGVLLAPREGRRRLTLWEFADCRDDRERRSFATEVEVGGRLLGVIVTFPVAANVYPKRHHARAMRVFDGIASLDQETAQPPRDRLEPAERVPATVHGLPGCTVFRTRHSLVVVSTGADPGPAGWQRTEVEQWADWIDGTRDLVTALLPHLAQAPRFVLRVCGQHVWRAYGFPSDSLWTEQGELFCQLDPDARQWRSASDRPAAGVLEAMLRGWLFAPRAPSRPLQDWFVAGHRALLATMRRVDGNWVSYRDRDAYTGLAAAMRRDPGLRLGPLLDFERPEPTPADASFAYALVDFLHNGAAEGADGWQGAWAMVLHKYLRTTSELADGERAQVELRRSIDRVALEAALFVWIRRWSK